MNPQRIPDDQVPIGHSFGFEVDKDDPDLPDMIAVCVRVGDAYPLAPSTIQECGRCEAPVYRSKRADQSMFILCHQCVDEVAPGWREA